jgi:hypothetical protein
MWPSHLVFPHRSFARLTSAIIGAGFFTWRKARDKAGLPVDLPLPASAQVFNTGDFSVTEDAEYLVAISAERTIPLDALGCLLRIDDPFYKCRDTPSAFNAAWELSANGKGIAHGSSSVERVAFWSDRVSRGIGRFAAKRGQRYRLDVQFLSDTSPLNSTMPHIQVFWLPPANYNEYGNSLLYALAKPAGVIFVLFGVILAAFEVLKSIRKAHIHR